MELLRRLQQPKSAAAIAREIGLPRQKVNYHLRELERHGLVEQTETRTKGNCVERLVRAVARHYVINPAVLGALSPASEAADAHPDRFSSAYLIATAAKAISDVSQLRERAVAAQKQLPTLSMQTSVRFPSAAAQHAFAEELADAFAALAAKFHDEHAPTGRRFAFYIGGYPEL